MPKTYRPWSPDQPFLLPIDPRDWLPTGHLVHFVLDLVAQLDFSDIEGEIQSKDARGERPYAPGMMVGLLLYAYCTGVFTSRRIERRTYEDIAFRYLAGGQHPDFSTICTFRRTHLQALKGVFVQVLLLCRRAGLVRLGHVSLDGTKVQANASKHKAMSYGRMGEEEERLRAEIAVLLQQAERQDEADDRRLGRGQPEADLPAELRRREDRLARIAAAKAALEEEARAERLRQLHEQAEHARVAAEQARDEAERKRALARANRREAAARRLAPEAAPAEEGPPSDEVPEAEVAECPTHSPKVTREGLPKPTAQRNFTDPDSRILERNGEYLQGYNCQAAVDGESQVIVAQAVSNQGPDNDYLVPMLVRVQQSTGALPDVISADAGFWTPANAAWCEAHDVDAYISIRRQRHSSHAEPPPTGPAVTPQQRMRAKVASPEGRKVYRRRKCIVEPVFGQIKQAMGFRRFSMRGMGQAAGEWSLVCTCHNIRKLWGALRA